MNKVVITGASGFLGRRLVSLCLSEGLEVWAVVRNRSALEIITCSNLHVIECDLKEISRLPELICGSPTHFIHLAWQGSTGKERGDFEIQLRNVQYSIQAVYVASKIGCKRFVGAGTLAELDALAYIPRDGSKPNLVTEYASAKLSAHFMTKAACNNLGVEHIWPCISNTYGPGNYTNNFINFAIRELLTKGKGEFTSGEQYYDFVYVDDTIQGLFRAAKYGKNNFSYYIGSNSCRKLKDYILEIRDLLGASHKVELGVIPFNGVSHDKEVFDSTKLMKDTGYKPSVSFSEGIEKTLTWIKTNLI